MADQVVERPVRSVVALLAVIGTMCVAGAVAERADGIPIRDMRVQVTATRVGFTAMIISPRTTKGCIANVQAAVFAPRPTRRLKALGNHRIDVCARVRNGTGFGGVRGFFGMDNIRAGRYAVCVRAVQDLHRGGRSAHVACRFFRWHGG